MEAAIHRRLADELGQLKQERVYKKLNHLGSIQGPVVQMEGRGEVIILSSNNYLGLSGVPEVIAAGREALDRYGAGTASVRFICGTFAIHREIEIALADWVGTEAALTYVSCWNANEGLLPTILGHDDIVFSDESNHASIIDSIRLAKTIGKCRSRVFLHSDMADLETKLKEENKARTRVIFTDGVFSMEGDLARLPDILDLAKKHNAIVIVDDSHGTGVLGQTGRGTAEHLGVLGEVDVITSTLGKALGGAAGGFVASSRSLCEYLIQKSRPQLFSNALPCTVAGSALAAVNYLKSHPDRLERLRENTRFFRDRLLALGFKPMEGNTPIIPVILGDTAKAIEFSNLLLEEGVFVTGFGYPVVPKGRARVRCQISAAHTRENLDQALDAFAKIGRKLELI